MTGERIVTVRLACGHTRVYTGAEAPPSDRIALAGRYRCSGCGVVSAPTVVHSYEPARAAA